MLHVTNGCCSNSCSCLLDEDDTASSGGMDVDMIAPCGELHSCLPTFHTRIPFSMQNGGTSCAPMAG